MKSRAHGKLFLIAIAIWAAFWIVGLPDYYQQYPSSWLLVATILLVPAFVWPGVRMIDRARPERRGSIGFWLSFYFTVPFLILDSLYCGWYEGHGTAYFAKYWYLTVFYIIPWLTYLPYGLWARNSRGR